MTRFADTGTRSLGVGLPTAGHKQASRQPFGGMPPVWLLVYQALEWPI